MSTSASVSIVIPYARRLRNLEYSLRSLVDQDYPRDRFEILIGCLEYSRDLLALLESLPSDLQVKCLSERRAWNTAYARNQCLRSASGDLIVLLDADMMLPRSALWKLVRYHETHRTHVVVGQMLDFAFEDHDEHPSIAPYEHYSSTFLANNDHGGLKADMRSAWDRQIPWSLCWTALVAIPLALVRKHELYFDESFIRTEDIDWGFRIAKSGIPIEFPADIWGVHLPHARDTSKTLVDREADHSLLLRKWPCFEVELVVALGVWRANQRHHALNRSRVSNATRPPTVVVQFSFDSKTYLALGVPNRSDGIPLLATCVPDFNKATRIETLTMLGMKLPYACGSIAGCYLLRSMETIPDDFQQLILSECQRVSAGRVTNIELAAEPDSVSTLSA